MTENTGSRSESSTVTKTAEPRKEAVSRAETPPPAPAAPAESTPPAPAPLDPDRFLDRELSWLEFNRRVLHEALDQRTPLLERLGFLGIFTSNLDEFFMKRVGRLRRQLSHDTSIDRVEGAPITRLLQSIRDSVQPMLEAAADCFLDELLPRLHEVGIHLLKWEDLTEAEQEFANKYFRENVFPVLTPQSVDLSHPFPFMSNLSTSLAVALRYPNTDERLFARVKVPKLLPQWIQLDDGRAHPERRFVSLREIIWNNLPQLFPGMQILDVVPIRVTRSADVDYDEEEADDLLELVTEELRLRRMQQVVRLEHFPNPDRWLLDQFVERLDLGNDQVYEMRGELDYTDFRSIVSLAYPDLKFPAWTPIMPPAFAGEKADVFSQIRSGDVLVHHPYESFDGSVLRFIRAAVNDPHVVAIKLTVYRTSEDSPFMPLLMQAAEAGKQVACVVELKARFDEQRNIRWANTLEDAGVHVVYGIVGIKTHCKTAIVVRREPDGLRCYCHIGTGNYNAQTAKVYTDLGLFSCESELSGDVVELFHFLTGRSLKRDYRKLLVAPVNMKERFLQLIQRELDHHRAGAPAHIIAKMNQLQDVDICDALYRASQEGLPIDLIVRGFCVLRPGVPEYSPTIRIISVIGRFLEHSRIYYFRDGQENPLDGKFFIGSADWMHRNLENRVEAVTPISELTHRERCWEMLQTMLNDTRQAWDMQADGSYIQRTPENDDVIGTHQYLMQKASQRVDVAASEH